MLKATARTALEMEEKQAKEIRTAFLSVLENASENYKSGEYEKEDLPQVNHQLHESLAIINDKSSNNSISNSNKMSRIHLQLMSLLSRYATL